MGKQPISLSRSVAAAHRSRRLPDVSSAPQPSRTGIRSARAADIAAAHGVLIAYSLREQRQREEFIPPRLIPANPPHSSVPIFPFQIKSSILHPSTPAIFTSVSMRGARPFSHRLTSFCRQPIFSASCPCVMPAASLCLVIGDPLPRSLGAFLPSVIFRQLLLSKPRRHDKMKEEEERRRCFPFPFRA